MRAAAARRRRALAEQDPEAGFSLVELTVVMVLMGLLGTMLLSTFVSGAQSISASERRGGDTQSVRLAMDTVSRPLRAATDAHGQEGRAVFLAATPTRAEFHSFYDSRAVRAEARAYHGVRDDVGDDDLAADADPDRILVLPSRYSYAVVGGQLVETITRRWTCAHDPSVNDCTPGKRSSPGAGYTFTRPAEGLPVEEGEFSTSRTRVVADHVDTSGHPVFTYLLRSDVADTDADGVTDSSLRTAADGSVVAGALESVQAVEVWVSVAGKADKPPVVAVQRVTLPNAGSAA